ncbi:hedgehog acyltransferase like, b [Clupea harengus]|uniref:Hedgehog acyltransferase like, b n=1 Tax=Clupea harengus TaxID=7950 RepID=A0A6P8GNU1_CLUHA|nr:hedgehog acyltransferase like, b [Clupea harengus]XP_031439386.1 hedgehog acyltransferase like, b [Clupea harengus]XP_031439387.1 hedgehog acyltransferase like, b [Clupea harengus]XP_031439388.1 hedgehog acyltransferase like, b [Clupea harengus]
MGVKAALPKYELYFYNVVLYMAMLWAASWIYDVSSTNVNRKAFKPSVKPGWYYVGRKMDTADSEWVMWFSMFWEHILFALSGHIIFAKISSLLAAQYRSLVFMVYGMLAVFTSMGWAYLTLILSHCVLLYSISLVKLRWLCFTAGLATLATFKMEPFLSWQGGFVTGNFELRHVFFYGGCGFTIMRCMSFALENCERREGNFSFLELLKYNFYFPFFYFGPIMTFDKFFVQANNPNRTRKESEMWNISLQALLNLAVILVVDVLFHFMYILTIPADAKLLKQLSDWALIGLAYMNLVYDWVKAAVMFGVINTVSRLDHLDPPQPPKCITNLYMFSETHFDRGINDWLCKYVYNYLGGKHENVLEELIATLCTYGVTLLWLGPGWVVLLWAFLNCFGLNFELWTTQLFAMEPFASIEMSMSAAMSRRIRALFSTFNYWTIVLYNILALNSLDFAKMVAKRLFLKGFPLTTIMVMFVTYCLVQLIKESERRQALIDDPDPIPPPPPAPPAADPALDADADATAPVDPSKEKAE